MPLSEQQLKTLMSPLNAARVSKRKQGGAELSYLEAWDVKATLIRVFGFGGFSADVVEAKIVRQEKDVPKLDYKTKEPVFDKAGAQVFNWQVTAQVTLRLYIKELDCTYTETAIASQTGPDHGEVADFAIKTAESDALKRAAIYLGTQFGLSLYDSGSTREVIKVIFAPGQEYGGQKQTPSGGQIDTPAEAQAALDKLGAQPVDPEPSPNMDING